MHLEGVSVLFTYCIYLRVHMYYLRVHPQQGPFLVLKWQPISPANCINLVFESFTSKMASRSLILIKKVHCYEIITLSLNIRSTNKRPVDKITLFIQNLSYWLAPQSLAQLLVTRHVITSACSNSNTRWRHMWTGGEMCTRK